MIIKKVFAQISNPVGPEITGEPEQVFGNLISGILGVLLVIAGLLGFFYLLLGGIQWITSGGDKAGVEGARQKIIQAIIGLVIVFSTWAVMKLVFDFLGINFPYFSLPTLG